MDYVLVHHGILGQKWGVRRYQNEDGSLTPEGIKRYRATNDNPWKARQSSKFRKDERKGLVSSEKIRNYVYDKYKEYLKMHMSELLENAKKNDLWDLDYLEIRPDDLSKKEQYGDYKKYLTDPDNYIKNRYRH